MTCQEALDLISALVDRELPVPDLLRLERHVTDCGACREVRQSELWLSAILAASALAEEPPNSLRRRIMESISAEAASAVHTDTRRRRRVLLPMLAGIFLCAAAAAVALSVQRAARLTDAEVFRGVVSEHRASAGAGAAPLDITAQSAARLERWIKGRLGLAVALPPSGARGEPLVGARVATVDGRAAAHVVYDGGGRRISLFVTGRSPRRLPERSEHNVYGVDVYTTTLEATALGWWEDERHLYLAVMAADRGDDGDVLAMAARCVRSRAAQMETPRLRRHWLVAPARTRPAIARHAWHRRRQPSQTIRRMT